MKSRSTFNHIAVRPVRGRCFAAAFAILIGAIFSAECNEARSAQPATVVESSSQTVPLWGDYPHKRPSCVKGIHLTAYYIGSKKGRAKFEELLADTELNTVVIDVKETEGDVFVPDIKLDGQNVYVPAMPQIKEYLKYLKDRGIYTIARIVIFHDNMIARKKPDWAIHASPPIPLAKEKGYREDVWVDRHGSAWADPFNENVWKYNIAIAEKCADIGFQGVQFDYIRFPSDGMMNRVRYSKVHTSTAAVSTIAAFLEMAHQRMKARGVEFSIDTFGLTGSTKHDMGIGQNLHEMVKHVDVISPMMYPSHYAKGEYGIKDPNSSPYLTLHHSIRDTLRVVHGTNVQVRPYLQDFNLGVHYSPTMVREQIRAANDLGVGEWLLWNPACRYQKAALLPKSKQQAEWVPPADDKPANVLVSSPEPKKDIR